MLSYCDRQKFNLSGGFFIFLLMVTGKGIFICSANLTFVVDSMTSNLALISDRYNIKSAPKERISFRNPHVTVVLRHKFYSFLIWETFCSFPPTPTHLEKVYSCSHSSCTIFVLTSYSLYTQVMLILLLINVQYLQNVVFSF